ncbi:hypothetical protein [Alloacidobacterium sp.]|uniref:hypothetical protein n=1 Tax=Alloacidobacterium sp. TaxID=2951999 RepID=UPI002D5B8C9F|nr:hypothetical protein [Alloacidobacterium sp.]HYK35311.1 hypothetical protein [Alloacidobacterium sp.]
MATNVTTQEMFSIAAAHGITQRTVASWSGLIPRTPRVLVPIQVDALVVRGQGGTWADCLMKNPPPGATTASRRDLLPPPFTNQAARATGVYLHWALPDALTHGTASVTSQPAQGSTQQSSSSSSQTAATNVADATFPAIPDRWLVVRYYPSGSITSRRAIEAWVLRAGDYPTDSSGPQPIPIPPQPIPIDQWTEAGPSAISRDDITAMGRGDAAWAAYYDNVQNRLGFYDSLKDVQQGPISYLVCGWYSNSDRDPLGAAQIKSLSDFYAKMAEFQWKLEDGELQESQRHAWKFIAAATQIGLKTREAIAVGTYGTTAESLPSPPVAAARAVNRAAQIGPPSPAAETSWQPAPLNDDGRPIGDTYVTNGSWWPELTLYHGSAVAIGWPGIGWEGMPKGALSGEFGGPPPASDVNVMVGTTPTDALASLVAKARNKPEEARLLEAFMLGSLSEFDQADGPARTDALLQASAFYSRDGGYETEQIWIPAMPPINSATPSNPAPKDAGIFQRAVRGGHTPKTLHATPHFVERAAATSVSTATGQIYTLSARESEFSEILNRGDVQSIISVLGQNFTVPPQTPGHYKTVQRALPRFFQPSDPVILIQGAARSFKHGNDGNYNSDGTLSCRLTGFYNTELSCMDPSGALIRYSVHGEDLLTRGLENGSVPPECDDLLKESVLQDPGSAAAAAQASIWMSSGQRGLSPAAAAPSASVMALAKNYAVEQTAWWSTRDPRVDHGPLLANSGFRGTLPSPIAVTMPRQPWTPMHLDWEVQYVPSKNGIADWWLDENDFIPDPAKLPSTDDIARGVTLKGRAHLTAGIADTVASSVRRALTQAALSAGSGSVIPGRLEKFYSEYAQKVVAYYQNLTLNLKVPSASGTGGGDGGVSQIDRSGLEDIASALENMDVLCGALDPFHQRLRSGYEGDGKSAPAQGQPVPDPFFPLRAGFLRVVRLRLVDCFGQVLDLAGSSDTSSVNPQMIDSSIPMELDGHPNLQLMPPRFTSPSRLWLRFADNGGATNADGTAVYANATVSPVCGFLLPNHLDGALEFFDSNGQNQGVLRPDENAGIVWEDAPGIPSSVGQTPERAISNRFASGIARGLLDWGTVDASLNGAREDALSAVLRIIDSTLWAVDPFGHTGDEHLSLLIGHPVAVLRASLRLELQEPITPDLVNKIALPLRIGALKHWQDGLFGYFINDDYRTFYCADAAVAGFAREVGPNQGFLQQINAVDNYYQQFADDLGADVTAGDDSATPPVQGRAPVNHPYVNSDGEMTIRPNQEVKLTLLVEPQALVHGTMGLLPRKDVGLRRSWIATGLANISPTFRFGPVLVDPKTIKMPVAVESFGTWSWDHRTTITAWGEDKVVNATQDAILPVDPVNGTEGWLRLVPSQPTEADTSGETGQA